MGPQTSCEIDVRFFVEGRSIDPLDPNGPCGNARPVSSLPFPCPNAQLAGEETASLLSPREQARPTFSSTRRILDGSCGMDSRHSRGGIHLRSHLKRMGMALHYGNRNARNHLGHAKHQPIIALLTEDSRKGSLMLYQWSLTTYSIPELFRK